VQALVFRSGAVQRALTGLLGGEAPRPWWRGHPGLALREVPEVELPGPGWVRVAVDRGAVTRSDLDLILHRAAAPSVPSGGPGVVPGAEILGDVVEVHPSVTSVSPGDRVVVDPTLSCRERGFQDAPCDACAAGRPWACGRAGEPGRTRVGGTRLGPGRRLGAHPELPGGWAPRILAHEGQLLGVPAGWSSRVALLTLAVARVLPAVEWLLAAGEEGAVPPGTRVLGDPAEARVAALLAGLPDTEPEPGEARHLLLTSPGPGDWTAARTALAPGARVAVVGGGWEHDLGSEFEIRSFAGYGHRPWSPSGEGGLRGGEAGLRDLDRARALVGRIAAGLEDVLTHVYPVRHYRRALATAEGRVGSQAGRVALAPDDS